MISIKLKDRFVEYDFELYDKYTLLQGDSADGKTSLYELISIYYQSPDAVQCSGYTKLRNLPFTYDRKEIESVLLGSSNYVFIMDENHPLLLMEGFEGILNDSDNYFIIICREKLFKNLPIHLRSIVKLKNSGKYHTFVPVHTVSWDKHRFTKVITEDSKTGKKFLSQFFDKVESAGSVLGLSTSGKDCIAKAILKSDEDICVVFDVSGIGATYEDILEAKKRFQCNLTELAWESFEGYLLTLTCYTTYQVEQYSCKFNSYEKYATKQIQDILLAFPGVKYNKSTLPKCFRVDRCVNCDKGKNCPYFNCSSATLLVEPVKSLIKYELKAVNAFSN